MANRKSSMSSKLMVEKRECVKRICTTLHKEKNLHENFISSKAAKKQLSEDVKLFERILILEASGMDPVEMTQMADGMVMTAETLAARIEANGLHGALGKIRLPEANELQDPAAMKRFQTTFAQLGSLTKVLMSIADDISNLGGGQGGPLAELMNTLKAATPEGYVGDMMTHYDSIEAPTTKKRGFFSRASKTKSSEEKLRDALMVHMKKSPNIGAFLSLEDLANGIKNTMFKNVVRSFAAYNSSAVEFVDNDFLMNMSKQPVTVKGLLKGAVKSFFNVGSTRGR